MRVKRGVRTTMFGVLTLFQFSAAFLRKYTSAQRVARLLLALFDHMAVDILRSGNLGMAQHLGDRDHIRSLRDQHRGCRVSKPRKGFPSDTHQQSMSIRKDLPIFGLPGQDERPSRQEIFHNSVSGEKLPVHQFSRRDGDQVILIFCHYSILQTFRPTLSEGAGAVSPPERYASSASMVTRYFFPTRTQGTRPLRSACGWRSLSGRSAGPGF